MLERRGIISGYEGSKPRRVLIDESQLHQYAAHRLRRSEARRSWLDRDGIATLFPGADLVLPSLWEAVSGRLDVDWAIRDEDGALRLVHAGDGEVLALEGRAAGTRASPASASTWGAGARSSRRGSLPPLYALTGRRGAARRLPRRRALAAAARGRRGGARGGPVRPGRSCGRSRGREEAGRCGGDRAPARARAHELRARRADGRAGARSPSTCLPDASRCRRCRTRTRRGGSSRRRCSHRPASSRRRISAARSAGGRGGRARPSTSSSSSQGSARCRLETAGLSSGCASSPGNRA